MRATAPVTYSSRGAHLGKVDDGVPPPPPQNDAPGWEFGRYSNMGGDEWETPPPPPTPPPLEHHAPRQQPITDPIRLRRIAEIDGLLTSTPLVPLEVLDAVKAMLIASQSALAATAEARTLSDLERLQLNELARRKAAEPFDRRAAQIGALQRKFEIDYALKDTPSQHELTMLGTRPISRASPGEASRGPTPDPHAPTPAVPLEGDGAKSESAQRQARDVDERRSATKNSKRFHFDPGHNGFTRYKLAEFDRGQKLYGPGAKLGGYFVHPDARYDFQHDVAKKAGLPQFDGHNWAWDARAGRYRAPPAR